MNQEAIPQIHNSSPQKESILFESYQVTTKGNIPKTLGLFVVSYSLFWTIFTILTLWIRSRQLSRLCVTPSHLLYSDDEECMSIPLSNIQNITVQKQTLTIFFADDSITIENITRAQECADIISMQKRKITSSQKIPETLLPKNAPEEIIYT